MNNSKVGVWEGDKEEFKEVHVVTEHPVSAPSESEKHVSTDEDMVPVVDEPAPPPIVDGEPANYAAAVKGELHHENNFHIEQGGNDNLRLGNDEESPMEMAENVVENVFKGINNQAGATKRNISITGQKVYNLTENVIEKAEDFVDKNTVGIRDVVGDIVMDPRGFVKEKVNDVGEILKDRTDRLLKQTGIKSVGVDEEVPRSKFDEMTRKAGDVVDYAVSVASEAKSYIHDLGERSKERESNRIRESYKSDNKDELEEMENLRNASLELRSLIVKASDAARLIHDRLETLERNAGIHHDYRDERRREKELTRIRKENEPYTVVGDVCQKVGRYTVDKIVGVTDYAAGIVVDTTVYVQQTIYNTTGLDIGEKVQNIDQFAIDNIRFITGIDISTPVHLLEQAIGITTLDPHRRKANA